MKLHKNQKQSSLSNNLTEEHQLWMTYPVRRREPNYAEIQRRCDCRPKPSFGGMRSLLLILGTSIGTSKDTLAFNCRVPLLISVFSFNSAYISSNFTALCLVHKLCIQPPSSVSSLSVVLLANCSPPVSLVLTHASLSVSSSTLISGLSFPL